MAQMQIEMKGVKVMIGVPSSRNLHPATVTSLLGTQAYLMERSLDLKPGVGFVIGCAVIQKARDEVIDLFLKSDFTHLFWLDDDIVFEPEDFWRMLGIAQVYDVVTAAYPAKMDDTTTFFVKTATEEWIQNEHGLYEIEGIGLGFFCMSRKLVKELVDQSPTVWDDVLGGPRPSVFRIDLTDHGYKGTAGKFRSEDMAFCSDIRDLGYTINLDPEVSLGHVGTKIYRGSIKDALQVA